MTYYLKYRPQSLEELDQKNVRESLIEIVKSGNIPHALLFAGPKGTGKTSAARILAKIINCEQLSNQVTNNKQTVIEPCNECDQCTSIAKGQNIDVIELDAASHRGIDDVRLIRDAVKLSPALAKKKVYIIDEAHMLTTEASNALLKTLEEPPDHVVFILATTNPEKLIDTIRSRVTKIPFKKASIEEIKSTLTKIEKAEKIKISDEVKTEIAKMADGSFRDATKILEQAVSEGKDLTADNLSMIFSQGVFDPNEFLQILKNKDTKKAIENIERDVENGVSVKDMIRLLTDSLRNMLLAEYGLGNSEVKIFDRDESIKLINLLTDASVKLPFSVIEQVPLEIAVIEWCEGNPSNKSRESSEGMESKNKEKGTASTTGSKSATSTISIKGEENLYIKDKVAESIKGIKDNKEDKKESSNEFDGNVEKDELVTNGNSHNGTTKEITEEVWRQIISSVKPGHASTEALLRAAKPLEFNGSVLKLGVYYKFHKEHLEGSPHRDILEEAIANFIGGNVRVTYMLTEPPVTENGNGNHLDGNGNSEADEKTDVVLTEPGPEVAPAASTLTGSGGTDIMKVAEKIFSS